jgi:uncharacterized membrane protein YfcA
MVLLYLLAMVVESLTGFGGTVLSLTFGVWLLPLALLVPVLVLVNVPLNLIVLWNHWRQVDFRRVFTQLAPWLLGGMALGFGLRPWLPGPLLARLLGAAVACIAGLQLYRQWRGRAQQMPLPYAGEATFYAVAGVLYSLYGMCGPLVAYPLARQLPERGRLRATLVLLWLILNTVYLTQNHGLLTPAHYELALYLLPVLPLSYFIGNRLHHRIDERRFAVVVYLLMAVGGLALAAG